MATLRSLPLLRLTAPGAVRAFLSSGANLLGVLAVSSVLAANPLAAQDRAVDRSDWCEDDWGSSRMDHVCETRASTMQLVDRLNIDGGVNGGVTVLGGTSDEIEIDAKVWAQARSEERALEIMREVRIETRGGRLRASGPDTRRREGWGVSFEVRVPRSIDLDITTHNGGVKIADVDGEIRFDVLNGGVSLLDLSGDVRGHTTNGGLTVELEGNRWSGRGLDVETTNGGVRLRVPEDYSAELVTGTVNGGMNFDFPITVRGKLGDRVETRLGAGGPRVRVVTTNGGVRVDRR